MNTKQVQSLNYESIRQAADEMNGKRRTRTIGENEILRFLELVNENPQKRVRVYSSDGFVPNSYKYPAPITFLEYQNGSAIVGVADAKRSRGNGTTEVVQ